MFCHWTASITLDVEGDLIISSVNTIFVEESVAILFYSELKSVFLVLINVSVTAITSNICVRARHLSSSKLFLRQRAFKLNLRSGNRGGGTCVGSLSLVRCES